MLQMLLPGVESLNAGGKVIELRAGKIPHRRIFQALHGLPEGPMSLVEIYRQEVLPVKTRLIRLLGRKGPARISNTLLGYEVQSSYKRIHCPDMVTARYLKLFSELGCRVIKLPYDPTVTARVVPKLEGAVEGITRGVHELFPESRKLRTYVLRHMYEILRSELRERS